MGCLKIIDVVRRIEHVFSNQKVKTQKVPHFEKKKNNNNSRRFSKIYKVFAGH